MQRILLLLLSLLLFSTRVVLAQGGTNCTSSVPVAAGDHQCNHAGGVDQWFSYTAPAEQKVTISTCGLTTLSTSLELYRNCSTLWAYGEKCGLQDFRTVVLKAGEVVYIRWDSNGSTYPWKLTAEAPSAGDNCTLAKVAVLGSNTADYTDGWYDSFTYTPAASGKLKASSCGATTVDTYLAVGDGCSATLATSDNDCGGQSNVEIDAIAGKAYTFSWRSKSGLATFPWTLELITEVETVEYNDLITVSPNPNNGRFTISILSNEFQPTEVLVIDLKGSIVKSTNWESGSSQDFTLQTTPGMYFLKIKGKEKTLTHKLIIQ